MDYYDGNTVTGLWNYAQHYSLSDNSFSSTYGPSTPGALNLVSGQTHGVVSVDPSTGTEHPKRTSDPRPVHRRLPGRQGRRHGHQRPRPGLRRLLGHRPHQRATPSPRCRARTSATCSTPRSVSWGWFQGGFRPSTAWDGEQGDYAKCAGTTHTNVGGAAVVDYSPHHAPFQYYKSTSNPHHLPPKNVAEIGHDGPGQPQLRPDRLRHGAQGGQPARGQLPEGRRVPGRPRRLLRPARRAALPGRADQPAAEVPGVEGHRGRHRLRRLRRLVRPRVRQAVQNGSKDTATGSNGKATDSPACQAGPARPAATPTAAAPAPRQPLLVISPLQQGQLRRPHPHRAGLDHPVHRGQLAHRPDR